EGGVPNLVVDPVFVSKHGDPLLRTDAVDALRRRILPLAALVTPNLPEASGLAGIEVKKKDDMADAARRILDLGPGAVLVKGGHLEETQAEDLFFDGTTSEWLSTERIDTVHTHGTGCVLSAAIAAYLARGETLVEAVRMSKEFVTQSIQHAVRIGQGIGPVSPGWRLLAPPEERTGPGAEAEPAE
ncbi:MAG TPA: PfkB family carbohydrate kinase, partial [Actinomycetota bacterium]